MSGLVRRGVAGLVGPLAASVLLLILPSAIPGSPGLAAAACQHRRALPTKAPPRRAKRATICLLNKRRTSHALPRVRPRSDLNAAARRHFDYMEDRHCFAHQCAGEPSMMERIRRSGYLAGAGRWSCREILGWGHRRDATPRRMVRAWMRDPTHRSIILSRGFEHVGVGVVWGSPYRAKAHAGIYTGDFCWRSG